MTQREAALTGRITPEMERVAAGEGVTPEFLRAGLANGSICLPANPAHTSLDPLAIGRGLRTKVNANIGTSQDFSETGGTRLGHPDCAGHRSGKSPLLPRRLQPCRQDRVHHVR